MEPSSNLRVPKKAVPARLHLTEKQVIDGKIYLSHVSSRHSRAETVLDLMNEDDRKFIPVFITSTERHIMVSKKLILYVTIGNEEEQTANPTAVRDIKIALAGGTRIEGKAFICSGIEHSRVSDYLNDARQFLPLYSGSDVSYVNRDFIRSVEEIDESGA